MNPGRVASSLLSVTALLASACSAGKADGERFDALNSEQVEYGAIIDPRTDDAYFVRTDAKWGESGHSVVLRSQPTRDGWSQPEPVFGGPSASSDPFISQDGEYLYFTRAVDRADGSSDFDIWRARRSATGWNAPQPVAGVNSPADEYSPVIAPDGALYFASARNGGFGQGDIWSAAPAQQGFAEPVNLGPSINSPTGEWNLGISPDGSLLIFEASGRLTNRSVPGDLYLSRRLADGWSVPVALHALNTTGSELMPRFSQDGETLHYSSSRRAGSSHTDILSVPVTEALNNDEMPLLAIASRSAHEIVLVSLDEMQIVGRQPTGNGPHEVAVSPDGRLLFSPAYGIFPEPHAEPIEPSELSWSEGPSGTLTIWPISDEEAEQIPICPRAHGLTVTPNDGHIWVACEETGEIVEMDSEARTELRRWQSGGEATHMLIADVTGRFVIAANTGTADTSIIDRQTGEITQVATGEGAEGLSLSADGRHVWVGNAQENSISLVHIETGRVIRTFSSAGRFPVKLASVPGSDELWVVNTFSNSITIFGHSGTIPIDTLQFETPPLGILASPDGTKVVVSFPRRNEIALFDRLSRKEIARIGGIMEADGMTWIGSASIGR